MKQSPLFNVFWFCSAVAAAGWLLLSTPAAAASSQAIANDTWTYQGAPTTNYASSQGQLVTADSRMYLKFPSVGFVSSAYLYYYVSSSSGSGTNTLNFYSSGSSWVDTTITWNNQSSLGTIIATNSYTAGGTGWYTADITGYVNQNATTEYLTIVLQSAAAGAYPNVRMNPNSNSAYISYTPATLTKPQEPGHCWGFDDTQDSFGGLNLTLNNGATVGDSAGVVDYGLHLPSAFFSSAEFLSPHTAEGETTVAFWVDAPSSLQVDVGRNGSDGWLVTYIPGNYVQVYSDGSSVNLGTAGYSDFVAVSWSSGGVALTLNTLTYTDTLALPGASADTFLIQADSGAVVDQLMIFDYALSSQETAWLYRGGLGRSCAEWSPTSVSLLIPTPQYQIELPSGGIADISMSATAGELFIGFVFLCLLFLTIFVEISRWSSMNSGKQ